MPRRNTAVAAVVTLPRCAAAAALTVSCCDVAARRVSEHVGLPLAVSHRRLAINGAVAAHATLPHYLHAHILALALEHVFPGSIDRTPPRRGWTELDLPLPPPWLFLPYRHDRHSRFLKFGRYRSPHVDSLPLWLRL